VFAAQLGQAFPVTTPIFADRYCTSIDIALATTTTQTSKYPYLAPALKFVAKLPGSI